MLWGSTLRARAGWLAFGLLLIGIAIAVVWSAPWRVATAQAQKVTYIYSAKYICVPDFPVSDLPVVPGIYKTAINIRNFLDQEVKFTKKIVVANKQDDPRGPISERKTDTLKADEALEVDCREIVELLKKQEKKGPINSPKGFVVIESPVELEVVAVYTNLVIERDTQSGFTCLNKIVYFSPPKPGPPIFVPLEERPRPIAPGVNVSLEKAGQQEKPLPNIVHEIVLPCPPPPKSIKIDPAMPDRQIVPPGVNQVVVVNKGNNPVNIPGVGAIPPNTSQAWPVTEGQQIVIQGGPADVTKIYGISDLQEYLRRLLGLPVPPPGAPPPIMIAKKIIDIERSNKVVAVFKTPRGQEHLAPIPPGKPFEVIVPTPPVGVPINLSEAVLSIIQDEIKTGGGIPGPGGTPIKTPLPPTVTVEVIGVEYGVGKGAADVGPEVEMGVGQGVGVGVGAGISIDVEYIQPKRVER
jgi:hypothetical protein